MSTSNDTPDAPPPAPAPRGPILSESEMDEIRYYNLLYESAEHNLLLHRTRFYRGPYYHEPDTQTDMVLGSWYCGLQLDPAFGKRLLESCKKAARVVLDRSTRALMDRSRVWLAEAERQRRQFQHKQLLDARAVKEREFSEFLQDEKNLGVGEPPVKRGTSSFHLFLRERKDDLLEKNPGMSGKDLMRVGGDEWRLLSDGERQAYADRQAKEQALYEKESLIYNEKLNKVKDALIDKFQTLLDKEYPVPREFQRHQDSHGLDVENESLLSGTFVKDNSDPLLASVFDICKEELSKVTPSSKRLVANTNSKSACFVEKSYTGGGGSTVGNGSGGGMESGSLYASRRSGRLAKDREYMAPISVTNTHTTRSSRSSTRKREQVDRDVYEPPKRKRGRPPKNRNQEEYGAGETQRQPKKRGRKPKIKYDDDDDDDFEVDYEELDDSHVPALTAHVADVARYGVIENIKTEVQEQESESFAPVVMRDPLKCCLCQRRKSQEPLGCSKCGLLYHPDCYDIPEKTAKRIREIGEWRCQECKFCEFCPNTKEDDDLLLCDKCDRGYHKFCLDPPLKSVPTGTWHCPQCVKVGATWR